jgi:glucokinase
VVLAGDVGGTKTILGLFEPATGPRRALVERTYPSKGYPSLERIIQEFQAAIEIPFDAVCIGVAGPVVDGEATVTNLDWDLSEERLRVRLGVDQLTLLNDLQAIGRAIPLLAPGDLHTLNWGRPEASGAIAIVAPGTGLGEAFLTWDGERFTSHPSEGGHADFAPGTPEQLDLVRHVGERFVHVSCERVCSGSGIPNIYGFLRESGRYSEPAWLADLIADAEDPTPVIARHALEESPHADICVATMDLFASILGAEAGNMALRVLATGGVYLGGGVPRRILPVLEKPGFLRAFCAKGRMAEFLERIPVFVITNNRAALIGAALRGLEEWA